MKLWDKGFSIDEQISKFTVGDDLLYDTRLAIYDILASKAHAQMLAKCSLITDEECKQLLQGLNDFMLIAKQDDFVINPSFEDIHSNIEYYLTKKLGDVGKKIHIARSRNDQVLVATNLYLKDVLKTLKQETKNLFDTLIDLSDRYKSIALPGYTHLQVAMPSSFGLWFSAYAEALIDDVYFINAALHTVDQNPLGSAAGYGSSFPIDRIDTTQTLDFKYPKYNVVSAQLSRGKVERSTGIAISYVASSLARMSMDICLYMCQNFDFISFPNELTTGSSIMPHKKNPDVFELIRGKCNRLQNIPNQIGSILTNLPSGYHRDLQLCKEIIMPAIDEMMSCLHIMNYSIGQIQINEDILNDPKYEYLYSVDTLNHMVLEDKIPFRDAYKKIGMDIENGNYTPIKNTTHTHVGSKDNLCLDLIVQKMKDAITD